MHLLPANDRALKLHHLREQQEDVLNGRRKNIDTADGNHAIGAPEQAAAQQRERAPAAAFSPAHVRQVAGPVTNQW